MVSLKELAALNLTVRIVMKLSISIPDVRKDMLSHIRNIPSIVTVDGTHPSDKDVGVSSLIARALVNSIHCW